MQSVAVSHGVVPSLLQTPAAVPSPGAGSLHVALVSYTQQRTASCFPQVDRAEQLAIAR
jgi:hypothetical protein